MKLVAILGLVALVQSLEDELMIAAMYNGLDLKTSSLSIFQIKMTILTK